ncbi:HlyD family secretion protein [Desulfovibrio gilichinskyi]|uniref:Membrane fusion protein, multidrug efflux system n=1 Tax=Desulfovibrio gilichinskyi TaxID=1519643 RepID=A0A1X7CU82_9BACT|nr:HlyD family secretion protein [Desulfovibrio gilichinskyi]SMF03280.1 membrane fusion protein, multidrug efflux system [Desulfovibrio gilichinskyi]
MNKDIIESPDEKKTRKKGFKGNIRKTALISIVMLILSGVVIYPFYKHAMTHESTDDAFVETHVVAISPRVSGHVAKVLVSDNQQIKKGAVIAEIDPRDYQVALDIATARLESAKASLNESDALVISAQQELAQKKAELISQTAGLSKTKSEVAEAKAGYSRDESDLGRMQTIAKAGAVSLQEFDHAKAQERMSRANLNSAKFSIATQSAKVLQAKAVIEAAQGKLQQAYAQIDMRKAKLREAQAAVEQAKLNLSYTNVVAPCSGYITKKAIEAGNYVMAGQNILSIVSPEVWIIANFKETQIMNMRAGQDVDIEVDSYPGIEFKGHVDSIQRGTGSRFTLLPAENAVGNFIKVVQRVPVKITLDSSAFEAGYNLAPGMSVVPSVNVSSDGSDKKVSVALSDKLEQ